MSRNKSAQDRAGKRAESNTNRVQIVRCRRGGCKELKESKGFIGEDEKGSPINCSIGGSSSGRGGGSRSLRGRRVRKKQNLTVLWPSTSRKVHLENGAVSKTSLKMKREKRQALGRGVRSTIRTAFSWPAKAPGSSRIEGQRKKS